MRKRYPAAVAAATLLALAVIPAARADIFWNGDASGGTAVFGNLDCAGPGSVITAAGSTGHGTIFRFTKPAGDIRCESRGIRVDGDRYAFEPDADYWFGWQSQLSTVSGDFVVWQWKSYPNAEQNYPLIMTVKDGSVRFFYVAPDATGWTLLWSTPIRAGEWNSFAVGVHTSASATAGWAELYFNGVEQVRVTGRTWDSANEPKWGVYDRDDGSTEVINRIDSLRSGTSFSDLNP